jgi:hypothetical protein
LTRIGIDLLSLAANDRSAVARETYRAVAMLCRDRARARLVLYVRPSAAARIVDEAGGPVAVAPFEGSIGLTRLLNRLWLAGRRRRDGVDVITRPAADGLIEPPESRAPGTCHTPWHSPRPPDEKP